MIFTIDVEDWSQSVLDNTNPVTHRVFDNTLKVMDLLEEYEQKGTFFILGNVAKKYPELIRLMPMQDMKLHPTVLIIKTFMHSPPKKLNRMLNTR